MRLPPTANVRIESIRPLIAPALLIEEIPATEAAIRCVTAARQSISRIINGKDDRLLVVAGPCSIHDPSAALEYAKRLNAIASKLAGDLFVVMRCYFEKPRSRVGWKGLINDPFLDESFRINEGLRLARGLLAALGEMGLPAGCEYLDPIVPQFIGDLVSWASIGARTSTSQIHRELASGLSPPVGFKNSIDGNVMVAIDAVRSSSHRHHFLSVTADHGIAAIVATKGNGDCHIILRGGSSGPNYEAEQIAQAAAALTEAGLPPFLMVDCSHGNSGANYARQPVVVRAVAEQIARGNPAVSGLMVESFLLEGRQALTDPKQLTYGQSITDACIGWETTAELLHECAAAVRQRRNAHDRASHTAVG